VCNSKIDAWRSPARYIRLLVCLALCVVVTVSMVMPPAGAVVGIDDAIAVLILQYLQVAGLSFSTTAAMDQTVQDCYGDMPQVTLEELLGVWGARELVWDVAKEEFKFVVLGTQALWEYFRGWVDAAFDPGQVVVGEGADEHWLKEAGVSHDLYMASLGISVSGWVIEYSAGTRVSTFTLVDHGAYCHIYEDTYFNGDLEFSGLWQGNVYELSWNYQTAYGGRYRLSYSAFPDTSGSRAFPESVDAYTLGYVDLGTIYGGEDYIDVSGRTWENTDTHDMHMVIPAEKEDELVYAVDYYSYADSLVLEGVDAITGASVAGIPITGEYEYGETEEVDYPEAVEDVRNAIGRQNLKALFFSKFPFCLPWDLKAAFALLAAPAEAPHWEIDLYEPLRDRVQFAGDTSIEIDMGDYPVVGQVFRWTSTIGFCIALIALTRHLIKS